MSTPVWKEEPQSPYSNPEPESGKTNPFACNVCKRNYSRVDHLARHYRSHTREKPFICQICRKAFARADLLKRHSASHSAKRPQNSSPNLARVAQACRACASSKLKCGEERPCNRCQLKGRVCLPPSTNNTNPAQALAGTSDQNLNAPQSRDDQPEESLDWARPPSSTNPIKHENNTPNSEADLLLNTQEDELVLPDSFQSDDRADLKRRRLLDTFSELKTRPLPTFKLPDPESFDGFSHEFDTWLPSIKAKLLVDGAAIGDAYTQFYYVYLKLDSSVQARVLQQVLIADETKQWDYNSILDELARVYDNTNKREEAEEAEEAEDSLYPLRQGNDSPRASIVEFEEKSWPGVWQNTLPLNISLENRVVDDSTGQAGRGELQGVGQFKPTSPSQIQTGGEVSVEKQAQNISELANGTPGGGEVRYTQRDVLQQQDSHNPDLSQYHQEKPTWWEEVLGFQVTDHINLSQTNPSKLHVDAFQLPHVVHPSQENLSASPNSELGPINGILRHPGEHEPMNSTLAGSLRMIAVSQNMFPLSQSNGYVYHPPVMYGSGPDQNEDENSFLFLMV